MEWITEPSAGAEPMCNNCFFYAHGSCSTKCSSQECREKVVAVLSIFPFIKDIRNNKLCVDWQITEQQNIIRK